MDISDLGDTTISRLGESWRAHWRQTSSHHRLAVGVVGVLIFVGALLRLWGMPDGMLWSIDQSRDYRLAVGVLQEGWKYLPLLGPGAGGTDFHLGPLHTYGQIIGLALVGINHPVGLLIFEFLFSIATIGLFYVLSRKFFGQTVSLILTGHVAVGLLFVSLARFTWNPNTIPFFTTILLLAAGSLASQHEHFRRWTIVVFACAAGVLMQLHTITLVIVPIVLILWQWRLRLLRTFQEWALTLALLVALFAPVLLSEYITHFGLSKAFLASSTERIDSWLALGKAGFKMIYDIVWYHVAVLTGHGILPEIARLESSKSLGALLDRNGKLVAIMGMGIVGILSVWCAFARWVMRKGENERMVYGTLVLTLVIVSLAIIAPLSLSSDPRYFHIIYFTPLFAYGWVLEWLWAKPKGKLIGLVGATLLLGWSLVASIKWIGATTHYADHYDPDFRLTVMEEYYQANIKQYEAMSDSIARVMAERGKDLVYVHVPPYEERALLVALLYRHQVTMLPFEDEYADARGLYVVVRHAKSLAQDEILPERIARKFSIAAQEDFGTFSVFVLDSRPEALLAPMSDEKRAELIRLNSYQIIPCAPGNVERCRLRDLFNR